MSDKQERVRLEAIAKVLAIYPNADHLLYPTGYEEAIIGVTIGDPPKIILSKQKMVDQMISEMDDLEPDDDPLTIAIEWFEFNTWNSYVSDDEKRDVSPLFFDDLE